MIPGSSQGPPLYFDSAGGVYFGVADPAAGPLRVTVYRYYDGQTVQVTPDRGNQFLTTQIGQFVPFASGTAVVNTGGMSVFNGTTGQSIDTESGVWLMTPDSSGTTYTGDDLAPFNGVTYQALWQFPDGNAYATDLPVDGQTCLLGQISAATGQVNPDYCLDPDGQISNTDTAVADGCRPTSMIPMRGYFQPQMVRSGTRSVVCSPSCIRPSRCLPFRLTPCPAISTRPRAKSATRPLVS